MDDCKTHRRNGLGRGVPVFHRAAGPPLAVACVLAGVLLGPAGVIAAPLASLSAGPAAAMPRTMTVSRGTALWRSAALTTPLVSAFDGATFAPATASASVGTWRTLAAAEAPTRNEIIALGVGTNRVIAGERWNGTVWSALPFGNLATISASDHWSCDVHYESLSGDAVLAWDNGSTGTNGLSYRTWNGSAWSAAATATAPVSGEPLQLRMAASPTTNQMVAVVSTTSSADYALVWNGSSFGNSRVLCSPGLGDSLTDIHVAYEQKSGRALVAYGKGSSKLYYRFWSGAAWTAEDSLAAPAGVTGKTRWVTLASDPLSNNIALGVSTNTDCLWLGVWKGTAWTPPVFAQQIPLPIHRYPGVALGFESVSGAAIAVHAAGNNQLIVQRRWVPSLGWSSPSNALTLADDATSLMLYPDPASDHLVLLAETYSRTLKESIWDGTTWSTPSQLGASTNEQAVQPFSFVFPGETRATFTLGGTVFEDVNYGGGDARDMATAQGVARPNARVELYSSSGAYVTATATDAAGRYAFAGLAPGSYAVRVPNATAGSSRSGYAAGQHLAVQTFRVDASSGSAIAVRDHVGGQRPAVTDAASAAAGAVLNGTTGVFSGTASGQAQSVTIANVTRADIANIDFGYTFDAIVNTNDSGQGSLRQWIANANALGDAGLAQAGRPAGIENALFMLADGTARPGLNAGYATQFANGIATIKPLSALPAISQPAVLDAQTQPGWSSTPLIELNGAGAASNGLALAAGGSTVRGLVINRFGGWGMRLSGAGNNVVAGNYVGINAAGTTGSGNSNTNLLISDCPDNRIGGLVPTDRNVISGSTRNDGIDITGAASQRNVILGNYVGTDASGTSAIGNGVNGIWISGGASNNVVGGGTPGAGNVVSGNVDDGVEVQHSTSTGNRVEGNFIGTDRTGLLAVPNADDGVVIENGQSNVIGGTVAGTANVISGNKNNGVHIGGQGAHGNRILGNSIGTTMTGLAALPNGGSGVRFSAVPDGASVGAPVGNSVGGLLAGEANVIAFNATPGVNVSSGTGVTVSGNRIFGNSGIGIDLGANAVSVNNGTKNPALAGSDMDFPVLTYAHLAEASLTLAGHVGSAPNQPLFGGAQVEIYKAWADPTGYGQGQTLLFTRTAAADGSFSGTFDAQGLGLLAGDRLTATATDAAGNTSEFSLNIRITASVCGTVFEDVNYGGGAGRDSATAVGVARPGARVELYDASGSYVTTTNTDAAGHYSFGGLAAGSYFVRVVNTSVSSSRAGFVAGAHLPVQTFRTDCTSGTVIPVGDHVGGQVPAVADGSNGRSGAVLNPASGGLSGGASGIAQSFSPVSVTDHDIPAVDFGFSFNVVVNKNDAGQGSLRQFLVNANALSNAGLAQANRAPGIDHAVFMLADGTARPGLNSGYANLFTGGVATVALGSALPALSAPVVVDAQTQPGWTGAPMIELNGAGAGASASGVNITGGFSAIRGLVINRFKQSGVVISGIGGTVISGNYIGTNATGTAASPNTVDGVLISGSAANLVGGTSAAARNIISGNTWLGIEVTGAASAGNRIQGNYVGLNAAGTLAVPNMNDGIDLGGNSSYTLVGGMTAGAGNTISGNNAATMDGLWINLSTGNTVQGNRIGLNAAGTAAVPNARAGVFIQDANNNSIGGTAPGAGNTIAYNGSSGVIVQGIASGNAIVANATFSNDSLGIDLGNDGVTLDNGSKSASLPNADMDTPHFTGTGLQGATLALAGYVGGATGSSTFANCQVAIYKSDNDASGRGEGLRYLGSVTADGNGGFGGVLTATGVVAGDVITATATDGAGNTSEFGLNAVVVNNLAADLSLELAVENSTPSPGGIVILTATLHCNGPIDATGITVRDLLPAGLSLVSSSPSTGTYSGATGQWAVGTLTASTSATLVLRAQAASSAAGLALTDSIVIVSADQTDPAPSNNFATAVINVLSGGARFKTGTYSGNAISGRAITGLGFRPDFVMIRALNGGAAVATSSTLVATGTKELTAASPPQGNLILSLNAGEFTLGSDARVNGATINYTWIAAKAAPGALSIGSYVGDGSNWHAISGIGFKPDYMIVLGQGATRSVQKFSTEKDSKSLLFDASTEGGWIKGLLPDGFEVNNAAEGNASGVAYHYLVWKALPGVVSIGGYPGDGTDNRPLAGSGFSPRYMVVKSDGFGQAMQRSEQVAGDLGLPFAAGAGIPNTIQALLPDGFQAGSDSTVNSTLSSYFWAAFRDSGEANTGADLSVAVSVDRANPNEGDTLTFSTTITNYGPLAATGIAVRNALPAGFSLLTNLPSQGGYSNGAGTWSVGDLAVGATARLDLAARVNTGTSTATLLDSALVLASDVIDPNHSNDAAVIPVRIQGADLSTSIAVDKSFANASDTLVYTLAVSNAGPDVATGVRVGDLLPATLAYASSIASAGSYSPSTGVWSVGSVSTVPATLTIRAVVKPGTPPGTITNAVAVSGCDQGDPNGTNNSASASTRVPGADLEVKIATDSTTADIGDSLSYTVKVVNHGPDVATGVSVANLLPAGLDLRHATTDLGSFTPASGIWSVGSLALNQVATLQYVAGVTGGGPVLVNTVDVASSDQGDPVGGNNRDSVTVLLPSADLSLRLFISDGSPSGGSTLPPDVSPPNAGDSRVFVLDVTNLGPDVTNNVNIMAAVPPQLTYVSSSADQGSYDRATGSWLLGTLAPGRVARLIVQVTVPGSAAGQHVSDTAWRASSDPGDPVSSNDTTSVGFTVQSADLGVTLAVDDSLPTVGDVIRYSAIVRNAGPDEATRVRLVTPEPAGFTTVNQIPGQGSYDSATGVWDVGTLAPGTSATLVLESLVDSAAAGTKVGRMLKVLGADQADVVPADDSVLVNVTAQSADLAVALTPVPAAPLEGSTISFDIVLTNQGPQRAENISIRHALPAGLSPISEITYKGTYTPQTGQWKVGVLAVGDTVRLNIVAAVDTGTAGMTLVDSVRVVSSETFDPAAPNNLDSWSLRPAPAKDGIADLALSESAGRPVANVGDTVAFQIDLRNLGPNLATRIGIRSVLGTNMTYRSAAAAGGTYSPSTGIWALGALAANQATSLVIRATVNPSGGGTSITSFSNVAWIEQADSVASNDSASVTLHVQGADLAVTAAVDRELPSERDTVSWAFTVRNLGADDATQVHAVAGLPAGLIYLSNSTSQGGYTASTGDWNLGALSSGASAALSIRTIVATGTAGSTISYPISITSADQFDPNGANNSSSAKISAQRALVPGNVIVTASDGGHRVTLPGEDPADVLDLAIGNGQPYADTLTSLKLTNTTTGPGSVADRDGEWQQLTLYAGNSNTAVASGSFSSGVWNITGLSLAIPGGNFATLHIHSAASLRARDADALSLAVSNPSDMTFARAATPTASWPLRPSYAWVVDGMTAKQIQARAPGISSVLVGSLGVPVFSVVLPSNGYATDQLNKLNVVNTGTAVAGADIAGMELWSDANGDGSFDPATDSRLGALTFTGDRYEITGLALTVPRPGASLLVTCNVAETATEGRTLRLALPTSPDLAIGMQSDNDGPIDAQVVSPTIQTIIRTDRITWNALALPAPVIGPGVRIVPLLHLIANNSYTAARTLSTLTINNATSGPGTRTDLDSEISQLSLRLDGNGDGELGDLATDPLIGTGFFVGGKATFTAINRVLDPAASLGLFVTADVSPTFARDGDALGVQVSGTSDISFVETTRLISVWPLDSGTRPVIDGMLASQVQNLVAPVATIGASEGPVLALDAILPRNGYDNDVLEQIRVENTGTATAADLGEARLWRDGGDGRFDAGGSDDRDLGVMSYINGQWISGALIEPLAEGGARVYVAIVAAAAVNDSASVRFRIPVNGIRVQSGNDGPRDAEILMDNEVMLSSAALLGTLSLAPAASTVGQTCTATLRVRNTGSTTVQSIVPSSLAQTGPGSFTLLTGPVPATFDLGPGAEDTFTWTYRADSVGHVELRGSAAGIEQGSGAAAGSNTSRSNAHEIFLQALALAVAPVGSMPFTVNRGQAQVVPLSLTLTNNASSSVSGVRVDNLIVRIEDSQGAGIVPAELLSRVRINEGTTTYLDRTGLETSGATMSLALARPVVVESGGDASKQITLSLSLWIQPTTTVPNFRLSIVDTSSFTAEDGTSGAPVSVRCAAGSAYPIRSGLARIVAEATRLELSAPAQPPANAGRGQAGVAMLELDLLNPGPAGLGSDVRLSRIAVEMLDSTGTPLRNPGQFLERIGISSGGQTYLDRAVTAADDSVLDLEFASLLSIPASAPTRANVIATLSSMAPYATFRLRLADSTRIEARDVSTGSDVPGVLASPPLLGPAISVRGRADSLQASFLPLMPATLPIGARDVSAMRLVLHHPGGPFEGALRCSSLRVLCRDARNTSLTISQVLLRARVRSGGVEAGLVTSMPDAGESVLIPLTGVTLQPGDSDTLELKFDVEPTASAIRFQLLVAADGLEARDENLATLATISASAGSELPFTSGVTELLTPARAIAVGSLSALPAALVADGQPVPALKLTLRNTAAASSGPIDLDHLEILAADHDRTPITLGAAVERVTVYMDGVLWADSGTLPPTATRATLRGGAALAIAASQQVEAEVRITLRAGASVPGLRIGCDAPGIGVIQPDSPLLAILVLPEQGQAFPMWSEAGSVAGLSLAQSYSNFPNPFAAGRENTTFAFYLPRPGRVTLTLWTGKGDKVRTIMESAPFAKGLWQQTSWDGRNGDRGYVMNGAYLAKLEIVYDDGTHDQAMRKVAIVR